MASTHNHSLKYGMASVHRGRGRLHAFRHVCLPLAPLSAITGRRYTDNTDTLTTAHASGVHPPFQPGISKQDCLEAGDIATGRRAQSSRCLPGSGGAQVSQNQLRSSWAQSPVARKRLGLPSASCGASPLASCSAQCRVSPPLQFPPTPTPTPPAPLCKSPPPACTPSIDSVTSGMHCPLIVKPIIVIK
jgi:hypothetical protein